MTGIYNPGHSWSAETMERDRQGFAKAEATVPTDYLDLCVYVGLHPRYLRAMIAGVDKHDEMAVDAALRTGIHKLDPALDDYAHLFIAALYVPLETTAGLHLELLAAE